MATINLSLRFYFENPLLKGNELNQLQKVIREQAPKWAKGLHIWRSNVDKRIIDFKVKGSLRNNIVSICSHRGPFFRQLSSKLGPVPKQVHGSVEVRGSYDDLEMIILVDELGSRRIGDELKWLNYVSVGIYSSKIEDIDYTIWARNFFENFCKRFYPIYAYAASNEEYTTKNMLIKNGVVQALGVDISKYLPGIYWLNFCSERYYKILNLDKLLKVPAYRVIKVNEGLLLELSNSPNAWNLRKYKDLEIEIRDKLGADHFFAKGNS